MRAPWRPAPDAAPAPERVAVATPRRRAPRRRTPLRERNPVAVGTVALALAAVLVYGAFHLEDLPYLSGTGYRAAFRDASGLAVGDEVRVAGVKVGKVTGVGLARRPGPTGATYVRVDFQVTDAWLHLGRDTEALIRIKTVLGQKYLALVPGGPGRLPPGGQIPLSRTASPFDVVDAVNGLAQRLGQIDTGQLAAAFASLARTFADTPASVSASLDGLSRLTASLAQRDAELRDLLANAHGVTGVLAQRDDQFRALVTDADRLLAEVIARRDAIHELLVSTTQLADQLSGLVTDQRARLRPALVALHGVLDTLRRDGTNLDRTIASMAPFIDAFTNVLGNGRWFDSYVNGLVQPFQPQAGS